MVKKNAEQPAEPNKFTKEQLITCNKFRHNRDLVTALLCDDSMCTIDELNGKIENYLKGQVK